MDMASRRSNRSAPKIERRVIEKNRRNHIKTLYANLFSLLPQHEDSSKDMLSLADRLREATNFITSLEMKVKEIKEYKEILLKGKNESHVASIRESICAQKSSQIKVRQMGSTLHVIVVCGQDCNFISSDVVCVIHEEGAEVMNASFSTLGDTVFYSIHANVGEFVPHFLAERVSNKLKQLMNGSSSDEEQQSWRFEIQQDTNNQLQIQKVSPLMEINPSYFSLFDTIM